MDFVITRNRTVRLNRFLYYASAHVLNENGARSGSTSSGCSHEYDRLNPDHISTLH